MGDIKEVVAKAAGVLGLITTISLVHALISSL
jgi:hypothetical protein